MNKSFYSCLDPKVSAPQPEQHALIRLMAKNNNGKIVFYGAEDYFFSTTQPFILSKLRRTPNLDGVIFFTLNQFCHAGNLNLKLMKDIILLKLSIHFAREDISIFNTVDLYENYVQLRSYAHTQQEGFALPNISD